MIQAKTVWCLEVVDNKNSLYDAIELISEFYFLEMSKMHDAF